MPRRDGTGPAGRGAGTGRGMGKCNTGSVNSALQSSDIPNQLLGWGIKIASTTVRNFLNRKKQLNITNKKN